MPNKSPAARRNVKARAKDVMAAPDEAPNVDHVAATAVAESRERATPDTAEEGAVTGAVAGTDVRGTKRRARDREVNVAKSQRTVPRTPVRGGTTAGAGARATGETSNDTTTSSIRLG